MTSFDLYSLSLHMIDDIDSPEGIDPDELAPRLAAWLDAADDKIGAIYSVLRRMDVEEAALKAEQDAFALARKRLATQRDRVREMAVLLLTSREQLDGPKVKRPTFSAWLVTSESVLVPDDARDLPAEFVVTKTTYSADKNAIKTAIKGGDTVPGCAIVESRSVTFRGVK